MQDVSRGTIAGQWKILYLARMFHVKHFLLRDGRERYAVQQEFELGHFGCSTWNNQFQPSPPAKSVMPHSYRGSERSTWNIGRLGVEFRSGYAGK